MYSLIVNNPERPRSKHEICLAVERIHPPQGLPFRGKRDERDACLHMAAFASLGVHWYQGYLENVEDVYIRPLRLFVFSETPMLLRL